MTEPTGSRAPIECIAGGDPCGVCVREGRCAWDATGSRAAKNTPKFEELRKYVTPEMNQEARDFLAGYPEPHAPPDRAAVEWCRECRDERPMGSPGVPADFILWGKLLPPAALGPRCYDHAAAHLGHAAMSRIDQYAVFDLRTVRRAS